MPTMWCLPRARAAAGAGRGDRGGSRPARQTLAACTLRRRPRRLSVRHPGAVRFFFAPVNRSVGGIADVYFSRHVFPAPVADRAGSARRPVGAEASGDRTLTYFIAHEITHIMTVRRLGPLRYLNLERGNGRDTRTMSERAAPSTSRRRCGISRRAPRRWTRNGPASTFGTISWSPTCSTTRDDGRGPALDGMPSAPIEAALATSAELHR
jgi:hypothetical protein